MITGSSLDTTRFWVQRAMRTWKIRIPLQVVLSGMDEVFDLSAQLAQIRHILLCGLLGSHRGHPRLHIQPDVQQFVGQPQLVWHVGEAQGVVDHTGVVGNESAPSPADLKHVLGHQQLHGLSHRASSDVQLLGQIEFVGELFPVSQLAVDDELADLLGSLLGQGQLLLFYRLKKCFRHEKYRPFPASTRDLKGQRVGHPTYVV